MPELERWPRCRGSECGRKTVIDLWLAIEAVCRAAPRPTHPEHISHCLHELAEARHLTNNRNEVEMALWFHDAIYDPKAKDNEKRSAELGRRIAIRAGLSEAFAQSVYFLILATRHHGAADGNDTRFFRDSWIGRRLIRRNSSSASTRTRPGQTWSGL